MENHNLQRAVEGIIAGGKCQRYLKDVCCCRHMALGIGGIKTEVMDVPGSSWQSRLAVNFPQESMSVPPATFYLGKVSVSIKFLCSVYYWSLHLRLLTSSYSCCVIGRVKLHIFVYVCNYEV